MTIPKKIHRIWLGSPMPDEFVAFGNRWAELHPGWEVRDWTERDLSWLQNRREFDDAESLASKADIARYEIVLREGGMYVDCDFEPLRPFDDLLSGADLVVGEQTPGIYANGLFAAVSGHSVLAYAVDQLPESNSARRDAISPQRTGPNFWTRCVRRRCAELNITPRVLTREQVYPYSWTQSDLRDVEFPEAYAVHHWAKSWQTDAKSEKDANRRRRYLHEAAHRLKPQVVRWRDAWDRVEPRSAKHGAAYVGQNRVLVDTTRGFSLLAQANDLGVTPSLVVDGFHDRGFAEFIRRELREGDVGVDVGANIGVFTLEMSLAVGRTGRVFSYEPNPGTFALLRESVYLNRMRGMKTEVVLRPIALGNTPQGRVNLQIPDRHSGMASLALQDPQEEMDTTLHEVQTSTLDLELAGVAEIRLLKIDVEGFEHAVLQGLRGLLEQKRIRLLDIELLDIGAGRNWSALVDELRRIDARWSPNVFTINKLGQRRVTNLARAIHADGLQHLTFEFSRTAR